MTTNEADRSGVDDPAKELGVEPVSVSELMADSVSEELDCIREVLENRLGEQVTVHHRMVPVRGEDGHPIETPSLRIVIREQGEMGDELPAFVEQVVGRLGYELAYSRLLRPSQAALHSMNESKLLEEREYHVVTWAEEKVAMKEEHRRPDNQDEKFPE